MAKTEYPIKTSADEFTRLEIQADLFRDDAREMLGRIGDGSGLRVLDLCCGIGGITDVLSEWVGAKGHVLGADLDTVKLDHARTWAGENCLTNVEFVEANAFDSGLPSRDFDLAHTRFALSVIQNGLGILDHMLTLALPALPARRFRAARVARRAEVGACLLTGPSPTRRLYIFGAFPGTTF